MMRRCCNCTPHHDLGQIEPVSDHRVTHVMCDRAAQRENAKLDADIRAGRVGRGKNKAGAGMRPE